MSVAAPKSFNAEEADNLEDVRHSHQPKPPRDPH